MAAAIGQHEGSYRQIATRFRVSTSFVTRLLRRRRQTGALDPEPHGGGPAPARDHDRLGRLRQLVREQSNATLQELRQLLGVDCATRRSGALCVG